MEDVVSTVMDSNLKLTLAFGIGLHHAGLHQQDRKVVEELFVHSKIQVPEGAGLGCCRCRRVSEAALSQVLIATSTLAWGVNFPAHLVVVKGTEYYDGKSRRYVDYPITGARTQNPAPRSGAAGLRLASLSIMVCPPQTFCR